MKKQVAKDKRFLVAKEMPPLRRTVPGERYSYQTDEVLAWIAHRPGLLCYIFDKLNQSGYITYDASTGLWKGIDHED